ncbi:MAG: hypothetical protein GXP39_07905 [Chloroflexi bacterium]|nr:hypothetical protein [Chloroflexota bacterium]
MMFEFALAERLGMTVAELRQRMSTAEFTYWVALEQLREHERKRERKRAEQRARARRAIRRR